MNNQEKPLVLTVSFFTNFAHDFEVQVELIDENRMLGLQTGWDQAIEHYCPDNIDVMKKRLKAKLGFTYDFHDLSDLVLRFKNIDKKWDEIMVRTDYAYIGCS